MKLDNPFYKFSLFLLFMVGSVITPVISHADSIEIPAPTTTVASGGTSAVEEMGKPVKIVVVKKPAVVAATVVELKSEYISKARAIHYLNSGRYPFRVSYSVNGDKPIIATQLPTTLFFYLNRQTHKIGVAYNKAAAKQMSISSERVFGAKEGETLKSTLQRWAKQAGFQMQWLSDYDYQLQYSYEFVGVLTDKFGPLNQILTSISGNNYVLKAVIAENKVILIKDNDYSPTVLGQ